jgi:hypothetical protein
MARRMAAVASGVHPLLRARGFRKRRNTFNRETEPGVVQVVAFAMGRYELFGEPHDPFAGEYGRFSVSAGVHVEEVARRLGGHAPRDFVAEPYCELRFHSHGSPKAPPNGWYLGDPHEALVDAATRYVEDEVLPLLDALRTRDALVAEWTSDDPLVPHPRGRLAAAMVELERGRVAEAGELVRRHLERASVNPRHRAWVTDHVLPQLESQPAR